MWYNHYTETKFKDVLSLQINETAIDRVKRMEMYFDTIKLASQNDIRAILNDKTSKAMFNELRDYLDCGQWLADYTADERGEFPSDLKRGVLSQDSLYDLICEIEKMSESL